MKPTDIPTNSFEFNIFRELNPSYWEYSKQCKKIVKNGLDEIGSIENDHEVEPTSSRVWVHLSCIFWIDELIFSPDNIARKGFAATMF